MKRWPLVRNINYIRVRECVKHFFGKRLKGDIQRSCRRICAAWPTFGNFGSPQKFSQLTFRSTTGIGTSLLKDLSFSRPMPLRSRPKKQGRSLSGKRRTLLFAPSLRSLCRLLWRAARGESSGDGYTPLHPSHHVTSRLPKLKLSTTKEWNPSQLPWPSLLKSNSICLLFNPI